MFDLSSLDTTVQADVGTWCTLTHPGTGAKLEARLRLAGADSRIYKQAQARLIASRAKRGKLSPEQLAQDSLEMLVKCTLNWEQVVIEGVEMACTPENVEALYQRFDWIKEQAEAHILDRNNYLQD